MMIKKAEKITDADDLKKRQGTERYLRYGLGDAVLSSLNFYSTDPG
jgi:hypothetical protein